MNTRLDWRTPGVLAMKRFKDWLVSEPVTPRSRRPVAPRHRSEGSANAVLTAVCEFLRFGYQRARRNRPRRGRPRSSASYAFLGRHDAASENASKPQITPATDATRVFPCSSPSDAGVAVQHFFVARLVSLDESARSGPESSDPSRGGYELDRVDLLGDGLASVDLKPAALKEFILANREALLVEAGTVT